MRASLFGLGHDREKRQAAANSRNSAKVKITNTLAPEAGLRPSEQNLYYTLRGGKAFLRGSLWIAIRPKNGSSSPRIRKNAAETDSCECYRCVRHSRSRASSKPSTAPSGETASLASREGLTALGVTPLPSLVWKPTEVAHESATMRTERLLVLTSLVCCPGGGARCK